MKKFNFLHLSFMFLVFTLFQSCDSNRVFRNIEGELVELDTSLMVFIFIDTDCPICRKMQGGFKKYKQIQGADFYFVFPGKQSYYELVDFVTYDGYATSNIILDPNFKISRSMSATTTPQVVVYHKQKIKYAGKIDDRFVELGSEKANPTTDYLMNALLSLSKNEPVYPARTNAVGCFIEPR